MDQLRLLGSVKELGPFLVCGKFLVGRKHRFRRRHPNSDLELRVSFSLHHAHRRWNIGVIAANGGANMFVICEPVYRRIKAEPADSRKKRFHPGMGGAIGGRMRILAAMIEVSADVATGNSGIPDEGNHNVSKILADTLPRLERMFNRRIYCRAFFYIAKTAINAGAGIQKECQGTPAFSFARSNLLG